MAGAASQAHGMKHRAHGVTAIETCLDRGNKRNTSDQGGGGGAAHVGTCKDCIALELNVCEAVPVAVARVCFEMSTHNGWPSFQKDQ